MLFQLYSFFQSLHTASIIPFLLSLSPSSSPLPLPLIPLIPLLFYPIDSRPRCMKWRRAIIEAIVDQIRMVLEIIGGHVRRVEAHYADVAGDVSKVPLSVARMISAYAAAREGLSSTCPSAMPSKNNSQLQRLKVRSRRGSPSVSFFFPFVYIYVCMYMVRMACMASFPDQWNSVCLYLP